MSKKRINDDTIIFMRGNFFSIIFIIWFSIILKEDVVYTATNISGDQYYSDRISCLVLAKKRVGVKGYSAIFERIELPHAEKFYETFELLKLILSLKVWLTRR